MKLLRMVQNVMMNYIFLPKTIFPTEDTGRDDDDKVADGENIFCLKTIFPPDENIF